MVVYIYTHIYQCFILGIIYFLSNSQKKTTYENPLDFQIRNEKKYPYSAVLALDLVVALFPEDRAERIFSIFGNLASGIWNKTSRILESHVFLKFNIGACKALIFYLKQNRMTVFEPIMTHLLTSFVVNSFNCYIAACNAAHDNI